MGSSRSRAASKSLPGKPLGPFRYFGTRLDDPNDIVPHEHRRELRAVRVFAAWLNHMDSRGINTLDTLVDADDRWLVRHHLLDFGSTLGSAPEPGFQPGLTATDPPEHTRLRRIVQTVFTPKAIARKWGPRIEAICAQLVDQALAEPEVDAYQRLTLPLPITVIAELLGVADGDLVAFKRWSDAMCDGVNQHLDPDIQARTEQTYGELVRYFKAQLQERRGGEGDDLVSLLCRAGQDERLSDREIIQFCILLLVAGNETTTNLVGNGLLALSHFESEQARLRADPALVPDAVEEMLRFGPPSQAMFRQTTRAVRLHGVEIPENQRVMLSIASANRDERHYDAPERFRIGRPQQEHVAFGSGIHFCLGAMLARLEARTLLHALITRTRRFSLAAEPTLVSNPIVRGPVALPMRLEPL